MSNGQVNEADVLIIGGGIQGLWLLDRLIGEHYSTILLERRLLGSQQTLHSHVYIHRGHVYTSADYRTGRPLVEDLQTVNMAWDGWLQAHPATERDGVSVHRPSCFGFQNRSRLEQQVDRWNSLGLVVTPLMPLPDVLRGSEVTVACQTTEHVLDGSWLVDTLQQAHEGCIGRIHHVEAIEVPELTPTSRIKVTVGLREASPEGPLPDAERRVFSVRAVILAAGAGNRPLLELAGHPIRRRGTDPIIRKGHMLVVQGEKDKLPPLTGIFPDVGQLFLVSRQTTEHTYWLISDPHSPYTVRAEEYVGSDTTEWLRRVIPALARLSPDFFGTETRRQQYEWGIYDAPKAEQTETGGGRPPGHCERVPDTGLWVILPTKLTLAPLMSVQLLAQLAEAGINPTSASPRNDLARAAGLDTVVVADEKWRHLAMSSWQHFRTYHMLT